MPSVEETLAKLEKKVETLEDKVAKHDTQYAVINTKLSAILWGIGIMASTLLVALIKLGLPSLFG